MLKAISNLFERSEFLIWLLLLEKIQPLRFSYDWKPEPGTADSRVRCRMRKLKYLHIVTRPHICYTQNCNILSLPSGGYNL